MDDASNNPRNLERTIWIDPDRLSGQPCFYGTRVLVRSLFDYLEEGGSIDEFLEDFEGVSPDQVKHVIHMAMEGFIKELRAA